MKQNKFLIGENMIKVGLTGGIGSGKSTVSKLIAEKGIPVIDADTIAREILILYPEVINNIKTQFGDSFFDNNGLLKRRELGNFVFKSAKETLKLESLTLPFIIKEIFFKIEKYDSEGAKLCIIDAPTLIETDLYKSMDINILVWVDLNTQIERVIRRDYLNIEDVNIRINSQMPLEDKKKYADFIIDNSGSLENTKEQLENLLSKINKFEVRK
jgi:dephospho-CoA kinase